MEADVRPAKRGRIRCWFGFHERRYFDGGDLWICPHCLFRVRLLDSYHWEHDIVLSGWERDYVIEENCKLAPAGWYCSRLAGHIGPCAARQVSPRTNEVRP